MINTHRDNSVLTNPAAYMGTITGCFLLPVKSYIYVLERKNIYLENDLSYSEILFKIRLQCFVTCIVNDKLKTLSNCSYRVISLISSSNSFILQLRKNIKTTFYKNRRYRLEKNLYRFMFKSWHIQNT